MSQQVLEGTWEEITRHGEELAGKRVRLTILDNAAPPRDGKESSIEESPLSELLEGLTGVVDSSEPVSVIRRGRGVYGEALLDKYRKQGLKLP